MRHRRPLLLVLFLLLAGMPATAAGPLSCETAPPPAFLARLWDRLVELLPLSAAAEAPPAAAGQGQEMTDGGSSPDLGLGMDPNG